MKPDLPGGLSAPARRALAAAGYTRVEQFASVTEADLLKLHGVGPKAVAILRDALDRRAMTFACRAPD